MARKKDENVTSPMYKPWTVIQGGLVDEEEDEAAKVEEVTKEDISTTGVRMIYILASPTGICGAFTDMQKACAILEEHPELKAFQLPENMSLL